MSDKPKLATFVDRITAVMLDAGVESARLKTTITEICGIEEEAVSDWVSEPAKIPPAENIAALSVYFKSDCVWLITGKYSSEETVCDRYNAEAFSCTVDSHNVEASEVVARDVKITQKFKD